VRGRDGASRTFVLVAGKRTCFAMADALEPRETADSDSSRDCVRVRQRDCRAAPAV